MRPALYYHLPRRRSPAGCSRKLREAEAAGGDSGEASAEEIGEAQARNVAVGGDGNPVRLAVRGNEERLQIIQARERRLGAARQLESAEQAGERRQRVAEVLEDHRGEVFEPVT